MSFNISEEPPKPRMPKSLLEFVDENAIDWFTNLVVHQYTCKYVLSFIKKVNLSSRNRIGAGGLERESPLQSFKYKFSITSIVLCHFPFRIKESKILSS